jgi:peptide chain release factor subunit 3
MSGAAPESWDDQDMSNPMTKLNINASEFVPSWGPPSNNGPKGGEETSSTNHNKRSPTNSASPMQVDSPAHQAGSSGGGVGPTEKESWEDTDNSAATPATTPEDEENSMENEAGSLFVPASKPRTKVKPKVEEATTTEKEHVNVVFIGHVDAGKSTIGGQIMYLTGMVDKRTLEKYEREAKEKNRESWYLSWCMDTNLEEREKGKTVEVGRGFFETEIKHFTILDAPGHKSFVPNMISGASQADLAVLVISARKGEFETGFERGGQTREHAMLVKTAGVKHMVVLVNKMDDPTVQWDKARYDYCKENLTPYLKKVGFNPSKDVKFMPCSGLTGAGLMESVAELAPWYKAEPFIPYINSLPTLYRNVDGPFMCC